MRILLLGTVSVKKKAVCSGFHRPEQHVLFKTLNLQKRFCPMREKHFLSKAGNAPKNQKLYFYLKQNNQPLNHKIRIMENYIVGMGEALWDILPDGKKIGGAPANFAYHVSQFGLNGIAVSAVGNDNFGDELLSRLSDKLKYCIEKVGFPTGTVNVTLDKNGIPSYEIKEDVAWDHIPFTPALKKIAENTKAFCFGSLAQRTPESRETILKFINCMNRENTFVIFDINLRQNFYTKEILENSFKLCNILKINDEELEIVSKMFGMDSLSVRKKCLLLMEKYNLRYLILTCGTDGSHIFFDGKESFLPTPKVKLADTVGAGDSFSGAFIASVIKGKRPEEAHRTAVDVAAFVCTRAGAMPEIPAELK